MGIVTLDQFRQNLARDSRVLGLDVGTKTIGVAFGSLMGGISTPLKVINRTKIARDAADLSKLMGEYGCAGLVVGWPLNVDGTEGKRCQGVRDVMLELLKYIPDVPVVFYDERFSTNRAEKFMIETVDMSRGKRDKKVDKMAAQIILQDFLEMELGFSHSGPDGSR
ncbi:MAG TPA: Holliday junction resolvase RuvX [Alphaproteobacteria bacterium]|nr:Holliday junction resolvase RuvX [Alphaproteobacteria bacterium]HNS44193.1 Holliday junction resolvase RuvX [Alphaproteobacteria bacterium]